MWPVLHCTSCSGKLWQQYDITQSFQLSRSAAGLSRSPSEARAAQAVMRLGHVYVQVPSMVTGGASWFTDLTSPDPYYGLPILTGAFMLAMVQLNAAEGMQGQSPAMVKNFKIAMSVLAVAIIPFSYLLPKVRNLPTCNVPSSRHLLTGTLLLCCTCSLSFHA